MTMTMPRMLLNSATRLMIFKKSFIVFQRGPKRPKMVVLLLFWGLICLPQIEDKVMCEQDQGQKLDYYGHQVVRVLLNSTN